MQSTLRMLRSRVRSLGASAADGKNIVAFSGGVDSSLVAALVHEAYPSSSQACVGVSSALPAAQLHLAHTVANHIGIPLTEVATTEGSDPDYIANEGQSCFHCKTHLYSALEAVAAQAGVESRRSRNGSSERPASAVESSSREEHLGASGSAGAGARGAGDEEGVEGGRRVVLFNGTNKDDKRDTTRVGLKAAADFRVASPIDLLTKAEVRAVSRELGLPNWNHAASPCLRSRLAFGVQATPERLVLVEKAEDAARKRLGLGVAHNLRVRAMHGNKALLEVDAGEVLDEALRSIEDIQSLILPLGFDEVDVRAFRSGAVSGGVTVPAAAGIEVETPQGTSAGVREMEGGVEIFRVEG
ncbi:unnamed protein product, partial [Hapterophycus canaliculatus]